MAYQLRKGNGLVIAFYTKVPKKAIMHPDFVNVYLNLVPFDDLKEAMDTYVKQLAAGRTTVWTFSAASINRRTILVEYLEWVDKVCDDLPEKTHLNPEEIVYKVIDIMEHFGYKSN
jgi:hypothetical protein